MVLVNRLEWLLVLVAVLAPFEDLVKAQVHPQASKAIGALLFLALVLRSYRSPVAIARHPAQLGLGLFVCLALAAAVVHPNGLIGLEVLIRYLSFAGVYLACVAVFRERKWLVRVLSAYALAAGCAAIIALDQFLFRGAGRARGPLNDPNDLAFVLVVAIPLAVAIGRLHARRTWSAVAVACLVGATATVSRGGAVALMVMLVWAIATGVVRPRAVLARTAEALTLLGALVYVFHAKVQQALEQKAFIAGTNVNTRLDRWTAALEMTGSHPLLGVGPAGFRLNYESVSRVYDSEATPLGTVVHQMLLEVCSELGIPALAAFTAFLGLAVASARRTRLASGPDDLDGVLASGVEAGLLGVLAASVFLTEQYYLPLWMLAAAAVALSGTPTRAAARLLP